jgi:hypothetical protein
MATRKLTEHEIKKHHEDAKRVADQVRNDQRKLDQSRDRALDRADRREWAHRTRGDERRWRE